MPETRVLRDERRPGDSRHLQATLGDAGLRVEGHDLGDGVARIFGPKMERGEFTSTRGPDIREYEWTVDVANADLPALREALGGSASDALLDVLERAGAAAVDRAVRKVPHVVVWSRLGD